MLEQLLSSPTLLWFGPWLGLDTHTTMELLCLIGAALSFAATLVESLRDSVVFFCLWALYLSMYQVSLSWTYPVLYISLFSPFLFLTEYFCAPQVGQVFLYFQW